MNSRSFQLFEAAIKSPKTLTTYTYSLHEFMRFAKIKNYDDIPKFTTDKIQKLLENWIMHLAKRELKSAAIQTKLSAVESFLEMNKVIFHKKILHRLIPSSDYVPGGEVPFTNEEIKKMLSTTTKLRTIAVIHFLASTGARPGSLVDPVLKLKHIEDMPHNCKVVKLYDGSKEGYWVFLTPEAAKALDDYLNSRKLNKEKLTDESPVFANHNKSTGKKINEHLSDKSLRLILSNLIKVAGIERKKQGKRYDKATVYGFRKRFNTTLKNNSKINSNIVEKLMAHKRGLDGVYYKPTREQCFAEFVKAIPELTIDQTERQKVIIAKKNEEITELQRNKERIEKLENGQQELCDIIYLKETIKLIENPNFLKKIKWVGLDGKEITDEKERQVIYKNWADQAHYMRKGVNQLSEKYMDKILR